MYHLIILQLSVYVAAVLLPVCIKRLVALNKDASLLSPDVLKMAVANDKTIISVRSNDQYPKESF